MKPAHGAGFLLPRAGLRSRPLPATPGSSRRQLHAISEEIDRTLEKEYHDRRLGIEGYAESRWILLDYGDIVVQLFDPETRAYYALEDLWSGAKRIPFEPEPRLGPG